jgi:hypothetical protein
LTGFDAPSCSTVYLAKLMWNHSLMKTRARANHVFPDRHSGMIEDYASVFMSLAEALAICGASCEPPARLAKETGSTRLPREVRRRRWPPLCFRS